MPNYKSLQVTTHALDIVEDVYHATRCFPSDDQTNHEPSDCDV